MPKYLFIDEDGVPTEGAEVTDDEIQLSSDGCSTILRWEKDHFEVAECEVAEAEGEAEETEYNLDWKPVAKR